MSSPAPISDAWGIRPILFRIGHISIPSYSFFVGLALLLGVAVFAWEARRNRRLNEQSWLILASALFFGALGAKIPIWIGYYRQIIKAWPDPSLLLSGRTIVGALIGGTIGVILVERWLKTDQKMGNEITPALAIGMAVGRIGCFFRGCCYGIPTHAAWGVNFGDGILRYPTQLAESAFGIAFFIVYFWLRKKVTEPGKIFTIFLTSYLIFRFCIEFFRAGRFGFWGLTGFQWAALVSLVVLNGRAGWERWVRRGKSDEERLL